jgi:hypothetical protein
MYSIERATAVAKKDVKFIPAGIQENVKFESAKYAVSPNGNEYLEIVFEKDGMRLTQTEWKPTAFNGMSAEDVQRKEDNQLSRLMQILDCFYPKNNVEFKSTDFKGVMTEVAEYLNAANKDILLRVKVVYNERGYAVLPSYARYTFIEPMVLPEGQTTAIAELGIDKFTRPVIADNEEETTDFGTTDTTVDPNGLPF